MSSFKGRCAATIVYPESAPSNWVDILKDMHIPCFISPLHIDGVEEGKKEHFHIMFMCSSTHKKEYFEDVCIKIGGVGCTKINDSRAYARYLCHLDEDGKIVYNTSDVQSIGGLDYNDYCIKQGDYKYMLSDMINIIKNGEKGYYINSFADFMDYCVMFRPDWLDLLMNKTSCVLIIKEYIYHNKRRVK